MQNTGSIHVGQASTTKVVRVAGKGTYTQSQCFHELVDGALQGTEEDVVVDLTECTYLDSTFLGCLVRLCKSHNDTHRRFLIVAPPDKQQELFASNQLHKFLHFSAALPEVAGEWATIHEHLDDTKTLGKHVMECHRTIGDLDVPDADKFAKIADNLDDELRKDE